MAGGLVVEADQNFETRCLVEVSKTGEGTSAVKLDLPSGAEKFVHAFLYPLFDGKPDFDRGQQVAVLADRVETKGLDLSVRAETLTLTSRTTLCRHIEFTSQDGVVVSSSTRQCTKVESEEEMRAGEEVWGKEAAGEQQALTAKLLAGSVRRVDGYRLNLRLDACRLLDHILHALQVDFVVVAAHSLAASLQIKARKLNGVVPVIIGLHFVDVIFGFPARAKNQGVAIATICWLPIHGDSPSIGIFITTNFISIINCITARCCFCAHLVRQFFANIFIKV
jgi:hypothetical protein